MKDLKSLNHYAFSDGHFESILIVNGEVKASVQLWNCQKLVIIFEGVETIQMNDFIGFDIEDYKFSLQQEYTEYSFYGGIYDDYTPYLNIRAESTKVFEVGIADNPNSALVDMDTDYIGGSPL